VTCVHGIELASVTGAVGKRVTDSRLGAADALDAHMVTTLRAVGAPVLVLKPAASGALMDSKLEDVDGTRSISCNSSWPWGRLNIASPLPLSAPDCCSSC
jgi:hypothetical protein